VTSQKTPFFIVTAVKTSNLTQVIRFDNAEVHNLLSHHHETSNLRSHIFIVPCHWPHSFPVHKLSFICHNFRLIVAEQFVQDIGLHMRYNFSHYHAVTQAVSSLSHTSATRFELRLSCGIYGGQSGTGQVFSEYFSSPMPIIHSTDCCIIIVMYHTGLVQ
jgi:hypothetical protein